MRADLALLLVIVGVCFGADPVLTPLTNNGNHSADAESNIVWPKIPSGATYKLNGEYDDGGFGPYFDMARGFVDVSFPKGIPLDLIDGALSGKLLDGGPYTTFKNVFSAVGGYIFSIVVGFLFMIIFPIIGCCFCCCRLCGFCGGKMEQKQSSTTSCKRIVFSVIFLVLVVFTGVGGICLFVSNERMSDAIGRYDNTVTNNLDDVLTFVDNSVLQINQVLGDDLNFAFEVLLRDIANTNVLVGIPLRDKFLKDLKVDNVFVQLQDAVNVVGLFANVEAEVTPWQSAHDAYGAAIGTTGSWKAAYNTISGVCGCSLPDSDDLLPLMNPATVNSALGPAKTEVGSIENSGLEAKLNDAKVKLDGIPARVKTEADALNLTQTINEFKGKITPILDNVNTEKDKILGSIDLDSIKKTVHDYSELAAPLDKYRWYGGLGIGCIIMLIVLLQLLGLIFGFCGSSASTPPTERSCLSTVGGNMIMASVGFIFIFSSFLMLLTTFSYALGAPMEKFLCQPISDPRFTEITKILKVMGIKDTIYGNVTIGDATSDCAAGKTVYAAFKIEQLPGLDLSVIKDYKSNLDLKSKTDLIDLNFTPITNSLDQMKTEVTGIKNSVDNLDLGPVKAALTGSVTILDINDFIAQMQDKIDDVVYNAHKADLILLRDTLIGIRDGSYAAYISGKNNFSASVNTLDTSITQLQTNIPNLETDLTKARDFLIANGSALLAGPMDVFIERVYRVSDALVARAFTGLRENIAPCAPIYNLFKSLVINGLCKHIIDAFNSFWFGIGWSIFFFLPSTIFGVKLAKHFRKMSSMDEYDESLPTEAEKPSKPEDNFNDMKERKPSSVSINMNAVGHSDKV